jgi:peptidyl-prolyl cis-trans isomerase C
MDSSKDNGGDLGWFTPDRMVKAFADAVVGMKAGEYTHKPVQTQYGWHVIQLVETRDLAAPPFDQVRQRLEQVVQAKKFKAYTDDLMRNAKIDKKEAPPAKAS